MGTEGCKNLALLRAEGQVPRYGRLPDFAKALFLPGREQARKNPGPYVILLFYRGFAPFPRRRRSCVPYGANSGDDR